MKSFVYAAVVSLCAGGAFAGGFVGTAPVVQTSDLPSAERGWTGFYAGLQYGPETVEASLGSFGWDFDVDAFGIHGGYQQDFGQYALGAELDYNRLDGDGGLEADLTRLRARAGKAFGRVLPYLTVGAAYYTEPGYSDWGVSYGLGVDFHVSERLVLGAEYTQSDIDDVDGTGVDLTAKGAQIRASLRF